jgi:hypothetical protein
VRPFFSRVAAALALALAVVSCASMQLSDDEQAALQEAMNDPTTFVVPRDHALSTWDRAQDFIDRYSTMKLRSSNDSLLVSYDAPVYQTDPAPVESASGIRFGYKVARRNDPDGIQIIVECTPSSKLGANDADRNAHIAAYYIRTGQWACDRCLVR